MPPIIFGDADIQYALDQFGTDVTIGATTAKGIVDRTDEEILQIGLGHLWGKAITVTVRATTFPAVVPGDVLTTQAMAYKVHTVVQQGDGGTTKLFCALE